MRQVPCCVQVFQRGGRLALAEMRPSNRVPARGKQVHVQEIDLLELVEPYVTQLGGEHGDG